MAPDRTLLVSSRVGNKLPHIYWRAQNWWRHGLKYWTHNFFIYEEDRKNQSKREFDLIPWDVDSTWIDPMQKGMMIGPRPNWDAPVCPPEGTVGAGSEHCIKCEPFMAMFSDSGQNQFIITQKYELHALFRKNNIYIRISCVNDEL